MSDWLHALPVVWMGLVIFGTTYLISAVIYVIVIIFATGRRAQSFRAVTPGLLSPLGVIFGLFVVFTAVQVWNDNDRAKAAIDREASALRAVVVFASAFPGEPEQRMRALVRQHIQEMATQEWPMMERQTATISIAPRHLFEALQVALALVPGNPGQQAAEREIVAQIEAALDARRQRIIICRAQVHPFKWICLLAQAIIVLLAIAVVHSDDRLAAIIALAIFATAVASCVLLIAAYDRPFVGQLSLTPRPLLQVMPESGGLN